MSGNPDHVPGWPGEVFLALTDNQGATARELATALGFGWRKKQVDPMLRQLLRDGHVRRELEDTHGAANHWFALNEEGEDV